MGEWEIIWRAIESGRATPTMFGLLFIYMLAVNHGPAAWRRARGGNGTATVRGQLDVMGKQVDEIHVSVHQLREKFNETELQRAVGQERMIHIEQQIHEIKDRCLRLHEGGK